MLPLSRLIRTAERSGPISITILGSTGSIGKSALDIVRQNHEGFKIHALVAHSNHAELLNQIKEFRPRYAVLTNAASYKELLSNSERLEDTEILCGQEEAINLACSSEVSLVVAAIVGMAGLPSVLRSLEAGKTVALANKESIVAAGALVQKAATLGGGTIIPVDSEHSALFQLMQGELREDISTLILTASGGPFRTTPKKLFPSLTVEQALKHPRWSMGAKISIDSATMMNKALEVIEASWLFGFDADSIDVVVHPESIVHSMIRLRDETVLMQSSTPDMRGPIAYALNFPSGRLSKVMERFDPIKLSKLTFEAVDSDRFPVINWAKQALKAGGAMPAVLNSANEAAVELFLARSLPFDSIFRSIESALEHFSGAAYGSAEDLYALDSEVRIYVSSFKK